MRVSGGCGGRNPHGSVEPFWGVCGMNVARARATILTVGPWRGMLLRMAISLLVIVIVWALVLLELRDSISS
jgi:hypothetical protein